MDEEFYEGVVAILSCLLILVVFAVLIFIIVTIFRISFIFGHNLWQICYYRNNSTKI
jgi:hypothetical protein